MQLGLALKEEGLDAVSVTDKTWVESMRESAIRISNLKGMVSSDDLREISAKSGYLPKHPNSWGAILRGKDWEMVGRKRSTHPSNHAREIKIFRWVGTHN